MTESEAIKKAIRHFECMKNDAVVVLDSGFGTHQGESDLLYRNRKMYAELAINALEKQIAKKPDRWESGYACCCSCKRGIVREDNYCCYCGQKIDWN